MIKKMMDKDKGTISDLSYPLPRKLSPNEEIYYRLIDLGETDPVVLYFARKRLIDDYNKIIQEER